MSLDEITPAASVGSDPEPTGPRWTLWLGPGVRPDLAERLLAGPGLEGRARLHRSLTDLADLILHDAGPGRVVTSVREVPLEDIGILRRFLERNPGRELVLLSDRDETAPGALLSLPRTRLFPRPLTPALMAFLGSLPERLTEPVVELRPKAPAGSGQATNGLDAASAPGDPSDPQRLLLAWQVLRERLEGREDLRPLLSRLEVELGPNLEEPGPDDGQLLDLGSLAEELLAGLSLERDRRMRFLFRPEGELSVRGRRSDLEHALASLFDLVGRCSSPDSVIRVRVTSTSGSEADPDAPVDTTIEFPDSPLVGVPLGAELDPEVIAEHFGADAAAAVRRLVVVTRSLGAQLESLPTRPGRRLLRLRLPRLAGSSEALA